MPTKRAKSGHHGGAGKCLACNLPAPDQKRLNDDLVLGVPLYRLQKQWGINRGSLRAHKEHHISSAETALTVARVKDSPVIDQAEELVRRADAMYQSAKAAGNIVLGLKALGHQRAGLELLAKLTGVLDERPQVTVNLQQSVEFQQAMMVIVGFVEERLSAKDVNELSRRLKVLDGGRT